MPRLLINGFPEVNKACFHIRVNGGAKGSGSQQRMLFDKTIMPTNGIYEIPLEQVYLGATIRMEVSVPGFLLIDKNVHLHTNKGYTTLMLNAQNDPDLELITKCYTSVDCWRAIQCRLLYNNSKIQFDKIIKAEQRQERNTFLAAMALVMFIAGILYFLIGAAAILVVILFAFYYHEKNKLNTWSDVT